MRRHGRRAVAFDGVRLALAGHALRGRRHRMRTARRWSTSCPFCRAPLLAGPRGELPAHLRPATLVRCGAGAPQAASDAARWVGVAVPAGAAVRSW
jgi:hypothetical protein